MSKLQKVRQNPLDLLSIGGWLIVFVALIMVTGTSGCFRAVGRATTILRRLIQSAEDLAQIPRWTKSLPKLPLGQAKDPKVNPMDRDPSDAIQVAQSPNRPRDMNPSQPGQSQLGLKQLENVPAGMRPPMRWVKKVKDRLMGTVRNGGRSFSRILASFPSYSRRSLRNIHMRWRNFRETHPVVTKYAKWVSWLSRIAVSIGTAVSLTAELYRTFHVP